MPSPSPATTAEAVRGPLLPLLLRCADTCDRHSGECLHAVTIKRGLFLSSLSLANAVVNLYAKCCHVSSAGKALADIPNPDSVSFNSLLTSSSGETCQYVVHSMLARGLPVSSFTLSSSATWLGTQGHCLAIKTGSADDVYVATSLVDMYSKSCRLHYAHKLFDLMPLKNSVSYAALISGYASQKLGSEAFLLFKSAIDNARDLGMAEECRSSEFMYTSVLSALCQPEFIGVGRQVHALALKNGLALLAPVGNSLLTFYAKCEKVEDAFMIFESLDDKNTITWSAVITGCAQNGNSERALTCFKQMLRAVLMPTEYTFVGVLNSCSDVAAFAEGRQAHACLLKLGFEYQLYSKSALLDMYAKCGSIKDARKLFDELHEVDDVVVWTAMIGGYVQNGEYEEALSLYGRMEKEGILPNNLTVASVLRACSSLSALELGKQVQARSLKYGFSLGIPIGSALSTLYAKCGILDDCSLVFRRMPQRDVIAWNSIISGFAQNGRGKEALDLFEEMKSEQVEPNDTTFINVLNACSHTGLLDRGWLYFKSMSKDYDLKPRVEHYACMVDMLTRAGLFRDAKEFTESVPIDHGLALWRIVLGSCRNYRDFDIGAYAGERLMELGSQESSAYTLLSNIYAAQCKWNDVERVRKMMRMRMVNKEPGCSWIELKNRVHVFVVGEQLHPETEMIYGEVKQLLKHMKDEGYRPAASAVSHPLQEQQIVLLESNSEEEDVQPVACLAS